LIPLKDAETSKTRIFRHRKMPVSSKRNRKLAMNLEKNWAGFRESAALPTFPSLRAQRGNP
jgi:hypothetical protein